MSATETSVGWSVRFNLLDAPTNTEPIQAIYYKYDPDSGLVEFKDAEHCVVYAVHVSMVAEITRVQRD